MTEPLPGVPRKDETPADQLRALWAAVDELRQQGMRNAGMSGGRFELANDAEFVVRLSNGAFMFYLGMMTATGPVTTRYRGFMMQRPNGKPLMYTAVSATDPDKQYLAILDDDNVQVVATDAINGGLGRPWIPMPSTAMPGNGNCETTSSTFVVVHTTGAQTKQQPRAKLQALVKSTDGGVGEAQFLLNGAAVGAVMPIAAGAFGWAATQVISLPGIPWTDSVRVELQIRLTNGTGSVSGIQVVSQRQS